VAKLKSEQGSEHGPDNAVITQVLASKASSST
jgi:hypothetical protein